jgi:YD repeat-containing protein
LLRGNDVDTIYEYYDTGDNKYRLERIQHGGTTDALPDFLYYSYDAVGNITELRTITTSTDTQSFTYDHLNRLKTAAGDLSPYNYSYTYNYDTLGNITSRVDHLPDPDETITYDYTGSKPHAVEALSGDATADYDYDDNGNMEWREDDGGDYDQDFDVENRLVKVTETTSGEQTYFTYDANGLRVKAVEPDGTTVHTPFPNYEVEFIPQSWSAESVTDPGFEGSGWTLFPSLLPGTALSITAPYTGTAHGGSQVLAVSNLASAQTAGTYLTSTHNFQGDKTYRVEGHVKGYLRPELGVGRAEIWFHFENNTGSSQSDVLAWSMNDLQNSSWETITDTDRIAVTAPIWATKLQVIVKSDKVNGWIAFDNLAVQRQSPGGSWGTLSWSDGDFEEAGDWTTTTDSNFPASSVWFGESGPAAAQAGRYSLVMSNLGYSQSTTPLFAMDNAAYAGHRAYAWLRGDIGSALAGGVYLVAHYYDSGDVWLGQETVWWSNRVEDKLWQQIQGEMEPISGTTQMQLQLVNAFTTGTFHFDDISAEYYGGFLVDPHDVPDPGFETGSTWTEWDNNTGTAARSTQ